MAFVRMERENQVVEDWEKKEQQPIRKELREAGATESGKSGDFCGWAGAATCDWARRSEMAEEWSQSSEAAEGG